MRRPLNVLEKLKIALYNLTTTTGFGGIETFNWEMAKALTKKGHTVHIFGGRSRNKDLRPGNIEVLTFPYWKRSLIPDFGTRFRKFIERLSFGLFSCKALRKGCYDIIYVHKPYDLPVAFVVSRLSGAKTVYGSGGTEFFPGYRFLVTRVDYFFACSKFNASQIEDYCAVRPAVLYNGVDTEVFSPREPDKALRERLGIREGEAVVVSACRLVGWKGIQYAIRAVAALSARNYHLKYLIIGDGVYRTDLEELVSELHLGGTVSFLGRIDNGDLPRYYSLCDFAVYPSVADETFGISIAEAMACGLPVVATRVGGIPEVIGQDAGLLVPPKDERALAGAIEALLLESEEISRLGRNARKRVCELFDWSRIADAFEEMVTNER
jgi:glycosyltransferase involved in cell wall biosynthesis